MLPQPTGYCTVWPVIIQELVTNHPWDWYLTTLMKHPWRMTNLAPGYAVFGQMEGDIFLQILLDLQAKG